MVNASIPPLEFKTEYPFERHFHAIRGLKQHYLDEGQGEPVVMVHGNPSWSFYYRKLVSALRHHHRVIVPDHIGCGLSDKPDDAAYAYTLQQRVDDLSDLLEHLGIDQRITLVVHDWGGMIGMAYACRHPERIARLVILNTAAFHLPKNKPLPFSLKLCRDTPLGPLLIRGLNMFARSAAYIGCKRNPMSASLQAAYCSPYHNWRTRIATLRFVQDIPLREGDSAYALVSSIESNLAQFSDRPMLIGWGELDFVFSTEFLQRWIEYFPDAEVHRYADCGHYILEDAGDELIAHIVSFLDKNPIA